MIFKNRFSGKPIGGNRTFTLENFVWSLGYGHNNFTMTAKTIEGKNIRPKEVIKRDGKLFAM